MRGEPRLAAAGVTVADLALVDWIGDEEQWVDPDAESRATETMLRIGLTSKQIEAQRLGRDYESILRQNIQAEILEDQIRAELGARPRVVQTDGLKVLPGGKAQGESAQEAEAEIAGKPAGEAA